MTLTEVRLGLAGLCAYRQLICKEEGEETVLGQVTNFFNQIYWLEQAETEGKHWQFLLCLEEYGDLFQLLRQGNYLGLGDYLWDSLRFSPSLYGKLLTEGRSDPALENGARREIDFLVSLCKLDCEEIFSWIRPMISPEQQGILLDLPRLSGRCPFDFDSLTAWIQKNGCGKFAQHQFFVWRGDCLSAVSQPAARQYESLRGYGMQREQVLVNTRQLMLQKKAQNILLFGEGGTGKSAVVKSMPLLFPGLRLIQIEHDSLRSLPVLMAELKDAREKFILFIDDLAFDLEDNTFSALKSILQGGLETPAENVLVYATSNRRYLVRQTFSERAGEEVDMMETIAEKTALAERFGLRIPYMSMSKEEYLDLVDYLYGTVAEPLEPAQLHRQAMMWEIRHGGRTPRVAEQFVASLA